MSATMLLMLAVLTAIVLIVVVRTGKLRQHTTSRASNTQAPLPGYTGDPAYRLLWSEFEGGAGYVVERTEDRQKLQWQRIEDEIPGIRVFGVAGESHYMDQIQGPEFAPGAAVRLVPEPDNQYDPNAVAVRSANGRLKGGHVPRTAAPEYKRLIESGSPLTALVVWAETRPRMGRCSLRILVAEADAPIDVATR